MAAGAGAQAALAAYLLLNPAYLARLGAQKTRLWRATPPPPATEPLNTFAV